MGYQVPRADHPWRRYAVRFDKGVEKKVSAKDRKRKKEDKESENKPVRVFLKDIVESWARIEVSTYCYGRKDVFGLGELPEYKAAAWIAGMLKKYYGRQY